MNFFMNNIFLLFIITVFSPIVGKLIKVSLDYYKLSDEYKKGNSLYTLLTRLTPKEFLYWSSDFISFLGFNDIQSINTYSNNSFICNKEGTTFFIECSNIETSNFISEDDINRFLGKLVSLSLSSGVIITSFDVNDDIYELINKHSDFYKIYIISLKKPVTYSTYFSELTAK